MRRWLGWGVVCVMFVAGCSEDVTVKTKTSNTSGDASSDAGLIDATAPDSAVADSTGACGTEERRDRILVNRLIDVTEP